MDMMSSAFLPQASYEKEAPASASVRTKDAAKAKEAAQEFEGFFFSQMFEHMFEGIGTDGWFGGGQGEKIFRSMLFDEYGKMTAKAGGIGIADQVARFILENQNQK